MEHYLSEHGFTEGDEKVNDLDDELYLILLIGEIREPSS
jgi:hypothetical protein